MSNSNLDKEIEPGVQIPIDFNKYYSDNGKKSPDTIMVSSEDITNAAKNGELGDEKLFCKLNKGKFCYDHASGIWYEWSGHYWKADTLGQVTAAFDEVMNLYQREAAVQENSIAECEWNKDESGKKSHKEKLNYLLASIKALRNANRRKNVLYFAHQGKKSLGIDGTEWDKNPNILGCLNGVVDLKTGMLRDGKPEEYIKRIAKTEYKDLKVPAPQWNQFINEVFNDEIEPISYIHRLFGYSITGHTIEHILPIFYGSGRNGKGVMLETLHTVLGKVAGQIQSEMLLKGPQKSSGAPTSDIMSLQGKRLIWASETNEGVNFNLGRVKWLCGGDTLTGREVYGKSQTEFTPTHTLYLLTNSKPNVPNNDPAFWDRIHLIPFKVKFVDYPQKSLEKKKDPYLYNKLKAERPGILAWLVQGCLMWQKDGLNPPDIVKDATDQYRDEEDIISRFLNECCETADGKRIQASVLYNIYSRWSEEQGIDPDSQVIFGKALKERVKHEAKGGNHWYLNLSISDKWQDHQ